MCLAAEIKEIFVAGRTDDLKVYDHDQRFGYFFYSFIADNRPFLRFILKTTTVRGCTIEISCQSTYTVCYAQKMIKTQTTISH